MKVAIITVAGISSRFNKGIPEKKKELKAIYSEAGAETTLLYQLLLKCSYADRIIVVGGYKFVDLQSFYDNELTRDFPQLELVKNEHYEDLGSGYSLYLGIRRALKYNPDEVLFVEGDLDMDKRSFGQVAKSDKSVLTYTEKPIYANKAVVLYQDSKDSFKYAFNSSHGLLSIDEPFSCILNSGQVWKFTDIEKLKQASVEFLEKEMDGTNLEIIQRYVEKVPADSIELVQLEGWTNCNTREDYWKILNNWRQSS